MKDVKIEALLLLKEGREKIKKGWCKHTFQKRNQVCVFGAIGAEKVYDDLNSASHLAACFLRESMTDYEYALVRDEMERRDELNLGIFPERRYVATVAVWNNHNLVTVDDVLSLYDRAIEEHWK